MFFGLCASLCVPAYAGNSAGIDADSGGEKASKPDLTAKVNVDRAGTVPVLTVAPKRCVLKPGQDKCRIQLVLSWESENSHSVCLSVKDDTLALACWEQAVRGAARILFVGDESVTYILSSDDSSVVSEAIFRIGRMSKQKRKSKKRRRRFWGFL